MPAPAEKSAREIELEEEVAALRLRLGKLEQRLAREGPDVSPSSNSNEHTDSPVTSPLLLADSIHVPPAATKRPSPPAEYKLSSQVLTVTREGMIQKSLADIIIESVGRVDMREPDTPRVGAEDSAFERGPNTPRGGESPESPRRRSLPPASPTSPASGSSPRRKSADLSADQVPLASALKRKQAKLPPLDKKMLDRICTVNSIQALRLDKMLARPIPQNAKAAMDYIASVYNEPRNIFTHDLERLYNLMMAMSDELLPVLAKEPIFVSQSTPCYTFGDIHGNYRDVSYFVENIVNFLDLAYTPCNLIFLGDYVDRGPYGVEVLCLLFSLKLSNPTKVTMLRGNHEDPLVNGDVRHYGESAFQRQCQRMFGAAKGMELWRKINEVFKFLPLAAEIDGKIFCCHGGIPRYNGGKDERLALLRSNKCPRLDVFSTFEPARDEHSKWVQLASDLCWSDPKDIEHEDIGLNEFGFGPNSRGDGVLCFGTKAVDTFLENHGYQYIFRAHQEKSDGLKLAKSGRVITIFTSSDYEGHRNGAGVLFVNTLGEIRMIMKMP
eukprot:Sspe_Gene.19397::Locus_7071_Transcript_1_1_Confidence_1.000_Length_1943::g.19397::m.19397